MSIADEGAAGAFRGDSACREGVVPAHASGDIRLRVVADTIKTLWRDVSTLVAFRKRPFVVLGSA